MTAPKFEKVDCQLFTVDITTPGGFIIDMLWDIRYAISNNVVSNPDRQGIVKITTEIIYEDDLSKEDRKVHSFLNAPL